MIEFLTMFREIAFYMLLGGIVASSAIFLVGRGGGLLPPAGDIDALTDYVAMLVAEERLLSLLPTEGQLSDERDTGYWSAEHDNGRAVIKRGTYATDAQRALCELSTDELQNLKLALDGGTLEDRRFAFWQLDAVLWGRYVD